jgi:dCTP deaminase
VTVTPLESGWFGSITLEITNTTDLPVRIYPGMGITQLQFFQSDEQCLVSYADRNGKYQNQPAEPVPPM